MNDEEVQLMSVKEVLLHYYRRNINKAKNKE